MGVRLGSTINRCHLPPWAWGVVRWLLQRKYSIPTTVKVLKSTFPQISVSAVRWHNKTVWKIPLVGGKRRGERCPKCRKVAPTYRSVLCRECYLAKRFHCRRDTKGSGHWAWKGGRTSEARALKNSKEYKAWRRAVFSRDDYTCQECRKRGGYLHAHHLKPKSLFASLIFVVENGQTLCEDCHRRTDTYGASIHKVAAQFAAD